MKARFLRRWPWLAAALLASLAGWGWWTSFAAVAQARHERDAFEARRTELAAENHALRGEIDALRHEREARARVAREDLAVAAPDEVLVVVPTPPN